MNIKGFISLFIAVPLFFQSSIVSTNAASLYDFQDSDSTGRPTQTQNINHGSRSTTRSSNLTSLTSNAPGFLSDFATAMSAASRTTATRTTTTSTSTAEGTDNNETEDEEDGAASNQEEATESENGDETSTVYAE